MTAVRAGGVLSCVSALGLRGVFEPLTPHTHIRLTDHAKYRRPPDRIGRHLRHCGSSKENHRPHTAVDPALVALRCAARCVSDEDFIAVTDSLLRTRRVTLSGIADALHDQPLRTRRLLKFVDARAESGPESLVRFRLSQAKIKHRLQVPVPGVGRVDLMLGNRLIIEVDGYEYHRDPEKFESDRKRDRRLSVLGYLVIRLTYKQVMFGWDAVIADIQALIRRGAHHYRGSRMLPFY